MATINASTTIKVKKKVAVVKNPAKLTAKGAPARRGSVAPSIKPATLASPAALEALRQQSEEEQRKAVLDYFRKACGERSVLDLKAPHTASTTRDRSAAAGDVAVAAGALGLVFVLKTCGLLDQMQLILFPQGVEALISNIDSDNKPMSSVGLKPSTSALSLASMDETTTVTSNNSLGTDTKRGKTTPANAREGCLLVLRALCELVGQPAEPYIVGAFLAAALDECGSSSSSLREAAEDASVALVALAHPWAFPSILCPILLNALDTFEWRVKAVALERLQQCAALAPHQVQRLIPTLIPAMTNQVWDTKAQVSKGARSALLAVCHTNANPDVKPAIEALVGAICKPADTNKAVSELMGTTFIVPVDASTLAILCPVLSRALKEKLAIHKRAACIVISNMSKLVVSPDAVAPFGSLLVPELKKVSANVQFEEIRDEALKALSSLTRALGDSYQTTEETDEADQMADELAIADAEQERIRQEREAEAKREEELRLKEEEERRKFKEAMDAQRELDRIAFETAQKKKEEEATKREMEKLSTKAGGKCQACGLKKCKKSCMFYSGN